MLEFWIADLKSDEASFSVPCSVGNWAFTRRNDYADLLKKMENGQCAPTYYASNDALTRQTPDNDLITALDELRDTCLILSFLTAACVTPSGTTPASEAQFLTLNDSFIRARAVSGFSPLKISQSFADLFARGMPSLASAFNSRRMRLFLSHWVSGLTCFSMEDIFLSVGVQMDIVKQCERVATGNFGLTYFQGMESASNRYTLTKLPRDYTKMRNDIVHEGVLSGSNFSTKNKADCAAVIASSLNWIDLYVSAALGVSLQSGGRWLSRNIEFGLPALTVRA
jgi:hypothetical protein